MKVLTPQQLATIIFGLPGFEAVMLDLKGTAVILDEVRTYSDVSRNMVLEIVRMLLRLNCAVHISTATLPTAMYEELLCLLGGAQTTYEVRLPDEALETYNRHCVYKEEHWSTLPRIIREVMAACEKVLVVCKLLRCFCCTIGLTFAAAHAMC